MNLLIPIRTASPLNARDASWRVRHRRVKAERASVAWALHAEKPEKPALPCVIRLTRLAPSQGLDDDNLRGALKAVRDQLAEWIGVDDRHSDVVRYDYAQVRAKEWGVRVEVVS